MSEGCRHCYAEQQAARIVRMGRGKPTAYDGLVKLVNGDARWTGVVLLVPERLADPLRWRTPRRVFVNSMSDLFHESLTNEQIAAVFGVMAAAPQHTFQVLTKRSARMRGWFRWLYDCCSNEDGYGPRDVLHYYAKKALGDSVYDHPAITGGSSRTGAWPLPNVWPGVSVEDRKSGVPRIDDLRSVPAVVRMLSCEPLLEDLGTIDLTGIGWLIDGCESGEGARPAMPEWFDSLEQQCRAAGVAYFHKQEMVGGRLVHDFPGRQEFPR